MVGVTGINSHKVEGFLVFICSLTIGIFVLFDEVIEQSYNHLLEANPRGRNEPTGWFGLLVPSSFLAVVGPGFSLLGKLVMSMNWELKVSIVGFIGICWIQVTYGDVDGNIDGLW